tara:strand:+ start:101727 stop:102353 length:627 start_codon:yes stop_codon:yes gene_type:complete
MAIISITSIAQQNAMKHGMDTNYTLPIGIPVHTLAPRINTTTVSGKKLDTDNLLKSGPVVVLFYRGEWCPVCNKYLSELNESLPEINKTGATVLVISPELVENAKKTKEETKSDFIFISDTSLQILRDYDVIFDVNEKYQNKIKKFLHTDIAQNNGQEKAKLPVPATYIINKQGVIIYKQFDYDYKNRASAEDILKALHNSTLLKKTL